VDQGTRAPQALGARHGDARILQQQGISVCGTPFGKQLGEGLFEFRLREEGLLVRVFCHAYGNQIVLLLSWLRQGRGSQRPAAAARDR
jgi:hypothetical protein